MSKSYQRVLGLLLVFSVFCFSIPVSLPVLADGTQSTSSVPSGVPVYNDDKQIELAAYNGPRRNGYRFYNGVYGADTQDPSGGWNSFITRQNFQDYIDCGFTYLLPESDAYYDQSDSYNQTQILSADSFDSSSLKSYMDLAEQMNIPVVVSANSLVNMASQTNGSALTNAQKSFISRMIGDLSQYSTFKGISLRDEPSVSMLSSVKNILSFAKTLKPDLYYFTSSLPVYNNDYSAFTTNPDHLNDLTAAYNDYINAVVDATGTFSCDYYPLYETYTRYFDWWTLSHKYRRSTYVRPSLYQNLELEAQSAKNNGFDAGITVQACAYCESGQQTTSSHPRATTTEADISFQVYSALAYGMKYINYYSYWTPHNETDSESYFSSMVTYPSGNGQAPLKTEAYTAVKNVNTKIKAFDNVFMDYNWLGTIAVPKNGSAKSDLLSAVAAYSSPRIASVSATDEAIVGCMKDNNGYDGFMLVNATDPANNQSSDVTVQFNDANYAIAYVDGIRTSITLNNGSYTFDLSSGQGVFVIPIKDGYTLTEKTGNSETTIYLGASTAYTLPSCSGYNYWKYNGKYYNFGDTITVTSDATIEAVSGSAVNTTENNVKLAHDTETANGGDADGIYLLTGDSMPETTWDNSAVPYVGDDTAGIYYNNVKQQNAVLKKYAKGKYYIGLKDAKIAASAGAVVRLQGKFIYNNYVVNILPIEFTFNGSTWDIMVATEPDVTLYVDKNTAGGGDANGIYLKASDSMPVAGWTNTLIPYTAVSGIYYNDTLQPRCVLKKYAEGKFYIGLLDGSLSAVAGDTVTIQGGFRYNDYVAEFPKTEFIYNGTQWKRVIEASNVEFAVDTANSNGESGIYLTDTDGMGIAGWTTALPPYSAVDQSAGVYYNGLKETAAVLKKWGDGRYYVGLADAGISAVAGDIVTLMGKFIYDGYIIDISPVDFVFDGSVWSVTT